jgi:cellobiose phosphorylase
MGMRLQLFKIRLPEKVRFGYSELAVAADVDAPLSHIGRGGWIWYTVSAGWMYRLIVESFLGLRLEVDKLRFAPCLSAEWQEFKSLLCLVSISLI